VRIFATSIFLCATPTRAIATFSNLPKANHIENKGQINSLFDVFMGGTIVAVSIVDAGLL
jgi:hypothetical protein